MTELKEELSQFEASSQMKTMEDMESRLQLAVEESERLIRTAQNMENRVLQLEAESKKQKALLLVGNSIIVLFCL